MEIAAIFLFLLFAIMASILVITLKGIDDERRRKKSSCVVYIMRVDGSGRVELKRSPEQLWNWKF